MKLNTSSLLQYELKARFSTSLQSLKKVSRLFKKPPNNKISLTPKFIDNIKEWPKLLNAEVEAQFERLNELIHSKADWALIEDRGLCVGNLVLSAKYYDVSYGDVALLSGDSISGSKWLRIGTPLMLNKINSDGMVSKVSEGHLIDVSQYSLKMCVYDEKKVDFSTTNYILTQSSNSGTIRYFQEVLKDSSNLSNDSVHLVNLAYRSIPMPSIHDRKVKNLPEDLNSSQQAAVSAALNTQRNLLCIQGPPGTGKTHVIAEVVHQLIKKKKKVLVCAPTHVAVANAKSATARRMKTEILSKTVDQQLCVLSNTRDEFQNHPLTVKLADLSEKLSKVSKDHTSYKILASECYTLRSLIFRDIFSQKRAVFSTLGTSTIAKLPEYHWKADVMLVDEAAQCTEPSTWVPVLTTPSCKKLVLVGDQKQLPAVVLSDKATKGKLKVSLMEKLSDEFAKNNINIILKEQYRMNEKIMRWSNEVFYENQLTAHSSVANITLKDLCPNLPQDHALNSPILMIDMKKLKERSQEESRSDSYTNTDELKIITGYVSQLVCDLGVDPRDIAVIAPYYAQIEQIRQYIPFRVDVNTVDAFQGHQREIVIFCLVRDNEEGKIGFLKETRRLNVAITRAKRQFILVGNSQMMMRNEHMKKLYKYLQSENVVFSVDILDTFKHVTSDGLPASINHSIEI